MDDKKARLTVLIDPQNKQAFDAICSSNNVTSSEVVRQLIVAYLQRHGVVPEEPAARPRRKP